MKKILLAVLNAALLCSFFCFCAEASELPPEEEATSVATPTDIPETQTIEKYDEKKGIASVRLMYCADSGARDIIKSGYAFFIGDEENVYLISCCDTVILSDAEKEAVAASHGVTIDKVKTVVELVLKNDVIVELSIVNSSEGMNFAILQASTQLSSCTTIRLCTENAGAHKGDTVHTYDSDMQQTDCLIEDWSEINDAHYYRYTSDYAVTKGLPLLNTDGEVIGIISTANKGNPEEYFALQIDEVIEVLDILAIPYNPQIVIDTAALDEAVARYEELSESEDKYTAESWKVCREAYDEAKELLQKAADGEVNSYTQDEVYASADALSKCMDALKKAEIPVKTVIIISVIVCACLSITIIVLVILLIVQSKKYKKKMKEEENRTVTAKEALKISGRVTPGFIPNNTNMPVNRSMSQAGNHPADSGFETSVLSADMNYQNFHMDRGAPAYPSIVRYKTGESVLIKQNSFIIGSSMDAVDYFINDNSNISRRHACIMKLEDGYYIQDLETTNGTFVNDMRVMAGRYVKLEDGNMIKLAEEQFEFKE